MKTEITDGSGVTMAGPDEPALAAAKARDAGGIALRTERMRDPAYREEISKLGLMREGSVGDVAQRQAGILPTGRVSVSNEMVMRAQQEGMKHEHPLGASCVRAMLEAALRG